MKSMKNPNRTRNLPTWTLDLPCGLKLGKVKLAIHRGCTGPQSYAPAAFTATGDTVGTYIG